MDGMTISRTLTRIPTNSSRSPVFHRHNIWGTCCCIVLESTVRYAPYLLPQVTPYICLYGNMNDAMKFCPRILGNLREYSLIVFYRMIRSLP